MIEPVLGTANLFALVPPTESEQLIRDALECGFTSIDTAPSYGHGNSEACVGKILRARRDRIDVTTKVGIIARPAPIRAVSAVKSLARRLPGTVQRRLRGAGGAGRPAEEGHFAVGEVRASVEASLRRLQHVDRLLLHEVQVDDLSDELLVLLDRYRVAGDVGAIGVATSNAQCGPCVARAPEVLTAANVSVAPSAAPASLPHSVTRVVGHGIFGAGGADLARVRRLLRSESARGAAWQAATAGTSWGDARGLADAMVARVIGTSQLDGVIVASASLDRLMHLRSVITASNDLPQRIAQLLDAACDEVSAV